MNTRNHKVELLAPAGNAAAFYGAVKAGADAVYLAGQRFGARAYAENFTTENLVQCIRYAHLFGRRVYLAVNTLLKEGELAELDGYLAPFYEAGLDAVIVQDLGVLRHIRERFPGLGIHASTQMTLCGAYGAATLKRMGADRVVPARELGLEELTVMKAHADIEIETFVHGAMCYSYSGQCLFSSILGGRSGNRGRCAQPCRLPYSVSLDKQRQTGECYPLSLKDMCAVRLLPQLIEAGIDSFKIEGRMKKPEYAAGVTAVYRKYIDRYFELRERYSPDRAAEEYKVDQEDYRLLTSLYIRSQVQEGYYFRRNGGEMVTLVSPAYSGSDEAALAEIAARYLDSPMKLPVTAEGRFETGSTASVSIRWGEQSVTVRGETVEAARSQPITAENVKKQLGKFGDSVFAAEALRVSVSEDAFYPLGQINELRRRAAGQLERLILEKNGYSGSTLPEEDGNLGERNKGVAEKETEGRKVLAQEAGRKGNGLQTVRNQTPAGDTVLSGWAVSVRTFEQLELLEKWILEGRRKPDRIYVEGDLLLRKEAASLESCRRLAVNSRIWIALPYIMRLEDEAYVGRLLETARENGCFQGFLARSLDEVGFLTERGAFKNGLECRSDAGVYAWNREAVRELADLGISGFCLPYELRAEEQRELLTQGNMRERGMCQRASGSKDLRRETSAGESCGALLPEKIVYSRIPMMITANCVLRTIAGCGRDSGEAVYLTDRYRKRFPVLRDCLHCGNIIYNSVPFSLHREHMRWSGVCKRLDFTLESAGEMRSLLEAFWEGGPFPFQDYTTGHEKRGV